MGTLTEKPPVAETPFANASLSERTKITKFAKARLNETDITYIETSFSQLAENGEQLIADFYRALFQLQPELSGLFEINSEKGQHKKMLAALTLLVNNLRYPDVLDEYLTALGMRHQIYGVSEGQMRLVSVALMTVLKQHAGAAWQAEIERAWREMLIYVTNTMLGAYQPTEEHTMAVTVLNEDQHSSLLSGSPILDNANTAMMIVDRELTITYVNPSLTSQLVEHEAAFRQQSAGISVTQLVGTQVELLFPQPQQARQLLTDPRQLPHTTELKIGSLIFRVTLSALWQGKDCAGMLLEWHNVTAEILRNADINGQFEALDRVMGIISFNMDGTIIDVNDNFLSVVGYRKEEVVGHHHRLFVTPEYAVSREYQDFWSGLNRSEPQSGEFHRVGFDGKSIWLQASYIPIFDTNGIPYKVVKYASDITEEKLLQMTVESVLSATAVVMKAMAAGDLTQQLQGEYEDEFAQLQAAVNDTVVNMATIVQDISDASISISAAASEISQGNLDLSQRTEEQAASLEETASSLEELTSTVRQNSDNARHANQLASDARERAEKGGGVIKRAIDAMTAISQSSKKVADIIGVIDEIAFQTNLLALNAAVEAARAGEQGRGFAVVAAEVRNLAQRSAAAAKEIKELIRDSGEKVSEGASLVDESGRTLDDIVESAKKVGDIISEIAAASIEQTAGIEQVNKAVTQMDEMTQQNAALVEQAAAASESLDEQGHNLQQKMAFFNTGKRVEPAMIQPAVRAIPPRQTATTPVKSRRVALQPDDEWQEF